MVDITYTALRNLKTGHSSGTDYTLSSLNLQQADEKVQPVNKRNVALSGNTVVTAQRIDKIIDITTDYLNSGTTPDIDDMLEFIHSTAHGEQFTYNDGTAKTVQMTGQATRSKTGIYYTWQFSIRVIS